MGGFGGNGLALPPPPPPPATGPLPPISSPFMRFPNSLPNLGLGAPPGYMFAGVGNNDYDRPRLYEEKNRPIRSPLLEEFRADKLKRWGVRVGFLLSLISPLTLAR